jgi:hypothetical protein
VRYLLLIFLLAGCAEESWTLGKQGHGKFQGNAKNVTIKQTPTSFYLHADEIDNATPTIAGGQAVSSGITAGMTGAANILLNASGAGLTPKVIGAASSLTNSWITRPAALQAH